MIKLYNLSEIAEESGISLETLKTRAKRSNLGTLEKGIRYLSSVKRRKNF